jgi:hypothetical protein
MMWNRRKGSKMETEAAARRLQAASHQTLTLDSGPLCRGRGHVY